MRELQDLLDFDPLDQAEKITGKSYKDDEGTLGLGVLLQFDNSKRKEIELYKQGDSVFSNTLARYLQIIEAEGFKQLFALPFTYEDREENFFIFWKADEGLLLTFDTFNTDRVNGGTLYFNLKMNEPVWPKKTSGHFKKGDNCWTLVGSIDCREAIRHNLRELRKLGTLLPVWEEQPFLWLLHYVDTKTPGYDHRQITNERLSMLPEEVQKAIGIRQK